MTSGSNCLHLNRPETDDARSIGPAYQTTAAKLQHPEYIVGQSDLFGLCYLLGYSFMPRIRDLPDQQLYRIDRDAVYPNLAGIFRGGVDADLIPEQWDQLVRVAASLKNRVCPAHVVVQRLANSSPSDRLAKALTMLGRVVKTIYILKYFNEEDLRHRVQLQLNRGEHRHSLARWIFFADRGEFRTGDYQEIMNKASCLSLVE